jgi:CTP synthase
VSIALVGKYTDLKDSYMSVVKALEHSALSINRKLTVEVCGFDHWPHLLSDSLLEWVDSSDLEPEKQETEPRKYHEAWRAVVSAG